MLGIMTVSALRLLQPRLAAVLDGSCHLVHVSVTVRAGLAGPCHYAAQALCLLTGVAIIATGRQSGSLRRIIHLVLVEIMHRERKALDACLTGFAECIIGVAFGAEMHYP